MRQGIHLLRIGLYIQISLKDFFTFFLFCPPSLEHAVMLGKVAWDRGSPLHWKLKWKNKKKCVLSRNRATSQLKAKMKEWLKSYTGVFNFTEQLSMRYQGIESWNGKKELCLHVSQDKGQ